MSDVSEKPKYWTLPEALRHTADAIDLKRLRSQSGLRWRGLGPTVESDKIYPSVEPEGLRAQPSSILPGRVTYVADLSKGMRLGVRQDLEVLRRAARPLRRALFEEVLQATGIPFGKNERVAILSDLWRSFILNFETSSVEDEGGRRFDGVRIHSATLLNPRHGDPAAAQTAVNERVRQKKIFAWLVCQRANQPSQRGEGQLNEFVRRAPAGTFNPPLEGGQPALRSSWNELFSMVQKRGKIPNDTWSRHVEIARDYLIEQGIDVPAALPSYNGGSGQPPYSYPSQL
jgi:hypothetical protein